MCIRFSPLGPERKMRRIDSLKFCTTRAPPIAHLFAKWLPKMNSSTKKNSPAYHIWVILGCIFRSCNHFNFVHPCSSLLPFSRNQKKTKKWTLPLDWQPFRRKLTNGGRMQFDGKWKAPSLISTNMATLFRFRLISVWCGLFGPENSLLATVLQIHKRLVGL